MLSKEDNEIFKKTVMKSYFTLLSAEKLVPDSLKEKYLNIIMAYALFAEAMAIHQGEL